MYCYTFLDQCGMQTEAILHPPIGNLRLKNANDYLSLPPYCLFLFVGHFSDPLGSFFSIKKYITLFLYDFFHLISFIWLLLRFQIVTLWIWKRSLSLGQTSDSLTTLALNFHRCVCAWCMSLACPSVANFKGYLSSDYFWAIGAFLFFFNIVL